MMNILIFKYGKISNTSTFINDLHASLGVGSILFYNHGDVQREGVASELKFIKALFKSAKKLNIKIDDLIYKKLLRMYKIDVILAQFGISGVKIMNAASDLRIPLITYFRGYDATRRSFVDKHVDDYKCLFSASTATISVSRLIRDSIVKIGADPTTAFVNPSGTKVPSSRRIVTDCKVMNLITVGRFVEKKAPDLTIKAFSKILEKKPTSQLTMIGDGPLLKDCKSLAVELGIERSINFTGQLPHNEVKRALEKSHLYIQHSLTTLNGESEGTPVSIMEASAYGLPIISTKHSGIVDVVIDGVTGYLVQEGDYITMAEYAIEILSDRDKARQFGERGRERTERFFSHKVTHNRVREILEWAIGLKSKPILIPDWHNQL